jgi:mRNA interferase RelE/StbE
MKKSFTVKKTQKFKKQLYKLDKKVSQKILLWIYKNLEGCENPRIKGKALTANLKGFWRYRIGSYRIITEIKESELIIVLITTGHRKDIYDAL